jgi:hypothetical protein
MDQAIFGTIGCFLAACSIAFCGCSAQDPQGPGTATYRRDAGAGGGVPIRDSSLMGGQQTYGYPSNSQGPPIRGPLSPSAYGEGLDTGRNGVGGGLPSADVIKLP